MPLFPRWPHHLVGVSEEGNLWLWVHRRHQPCWPSLGPTAQRSFLLQMSWPPQERGGLGHVAGGSGWGADAGLPVGLSLGPGGPQLGHRNTEMGLGDLWLEPGSRWVVRVVAAPEEKRT